MAQHMRCSLIHIKQSAVAHAAKAGKHKCLAACSHNVATTTGFDSVSIMCVVTYCLGADVDGLKGCLGTT